jgi:hypothetical protein
MRLAVPDDAAQVEVALLRFVEEIAVAAADAEADAQGHRGLKEEVR